MNPWQDLATRILAAIRAKELEITQETLMEEDEEDSILSDTIAELLREAEMDGEIHRGPVQD